MDNTQTAIFYGVTTPETSIELKPNWYKPTFFYWVGIRDKGAICYAILCYKKEGAYYSVETHDYQYIHNVNMFITPAPQVHEILEKLPLMLLTKDYGYKDLNQYIYTDKRVNVGYSLTAHGNAQNLHLSEAYALLYIKLREAGLLKEVQDE